RRIEEMARRMLDFGRKRSRRIEPCDVGDLISDALGFLQPSIRHPFIDVQLELKSPLPVIKVDRWQIVHALVNVLNNAVDAMAQSEQRVLSIAARAVDERLQLRISDTGSGIVSGNVSKIFDPFFTTKAERGAGLGLYVTKDVVEEHRGTINVKTSD